MAKAATERSGTEHTDPLEDAYDGIVIGSGLGGLSAAAFLAKAGKKMVVLERLDGPGGYAHAFRRGAYLFDPAVHAIGQGAEGLMLDTWLRALGVRDRVDLIPLDLFYTVVFPEFQLNVPFGVEEFIRRHAQHFPDEESRLRDFMAVCAQVKSEWDQLRPGTSVEELEQAVEAFPTVLRYRSATLQEVLDEYLIDPRLKAVVSALWVYQGAPPSRLGFVIFAGMLTSLLEGGQSYCRGSFQKLVDALVTALEGNGGELVVRNPVTGIVVEDGRVGGIRLADGREIRAPLVISNADARQTFERLVGLEHLPDAYLRRYKRLTTSTSAFLVYAATTLDLHRFDYAHEIFVFDSWDLDEVWRKTLGREPSAFAMTSPTLLDPSLAPPGEHLITSVAFAPYDAGTPWPELKDSYTDTIQKKLEELFPGIRERFTFIEGATPLALEKYSRNTNGAMYGWENTPQQSHARRLPNRTPIEGLYLASAWAQPSSGTIGVMQSGFQTAQIILGYGDKSEFLRSLGFDAR